MHRGFYGELDVGGTAGTGLGITEPEAAPVSADDLGDDREAETHADVLVAADEGLQDLLAAFEGDPIAVVADLEANEVPAHPVDPDDEGWLAVDDRVLDQVADEGDFAIEPFQEKHEVQG